mmetsp:Transcript_34087/g.43978  ORF Transcript_34087/g.43978 Transcript_34087/m.43978 type:complete len:561 (+) Transcript_34087:41-1723(+)
MTTAFILIVDSAKGLRSADFGSSSDPYCKVTCPASPACLDEKTRVIQDNSNPYWNECFLVALPSSIPPVIKLSVYDSDAGTISNGTDDFLGHAGFDLAQVISGDPTRWNKSTIALGGEENGKAATGEITINVRAYVDPVVTIVEGVKLRNADGFFGKSDPFARLSGLTGVSGNWGETATQRDTMSPTFNETFTVPLLTKFPMGGKLAEFCIQLWDEDDKKRGSSDDPLGNVVVQWTKLFPDPEQQGTEETLALGGKGAKAGSKVVAVFSTSASDSIVQGMSNLNTGGAAEVQSVKLPPSCSKAILSKNLGFKIADCSDTVADNFTLGLSWDVTNGQNIDLDASCIWLDSNLQPIDTVWFQKLSSNDGAMQHGGDEREGDAKGDDEKIQVDLEKVSPEASYLCFCINSFTGQELNDVSSAKCRLYNSSTLNEAASFDLSSDKRLDCTALLMCILYRANANANNANQEWYMHAVGEPATGQTVQDNIDEFQNFLTNKPLVAFHASKMEKPIKMAKMKVPPSTGPKHAIAFKTESGGMQEVKLPQETKGGDVIEVPIVDIYVA